MQITPAIRDFLNAAIAEDIGSGDITTLLTVDESRVGRAEIVARQDLVVAGLPLAREIFKLRDTESVFEAEVSDGEAVSNGRVIARIRGKSRALLESERIALNILQRLSGIASLTALYVKAVSGLPVKILDSRKTAPGMRTLEKYAVRTGGGFNHRTGLYDGILVKENHIVSAGGITAALELLKKGAPHLLKIEVEVTNIHELEEALDAGADVIMLDNMNLGDIKESVKIVGRRVPLEVSGNISLSNIRGIAETGVQMISVGAITHSAPAVDLSMLMK